MRITVHQLKGLIREAAAEAMEEMADKEHEGMGHMMEEDDDKKELQEAVAAAFRAGYRKGRAARR